MPNIPIKSFLSQRWHWILLVMLILGGLFILLPVYTTPGNSFQFQLSIYSRKDLFIIGLLAFLGSLNINLQIYLQKKQKLGIKQTVASGSTVGASTLMASVIGTTSCVSCVSSLLTTVGLGVGTTLGLLKYRAIFLDVTLILLIWALFLNIRKLNSPNSCPS